MPSLRGRWKALRPEMRPMPAPRLLTTAVRTASCRSFAPALAPLREIVRGYPGNKPLRLRLELADGGCVVIDAKSGVTIDPELRRRVEDLLGAGNFRLQGGAPKQSPAPHNGNGRRRQLARS